MDRFTLVELTADLPLSLVDRLVYGAYQSSHSSPVILWLRGISVEDIRGSLDGAVRDLGTGFAGVEYRLDPEPDTTAATAGGAARCVLSTGEFLPFLDSAVTELMTVEQALGALESQRCFCSACASGSEPTLLPAVA